MDYFLPQLNYPLPFTIYYSPEILLTRETNLEYAALTRFDVDTRHASLTPPVQ
jgi:hypothetical protein